MKNTFDKLPYGTLISDLKISAENKAHIDKVLKHLDGYVADTRIAKYRNSLTRFAWLIETDFEVLHKENRKEEVRQAGAIINKSNLEVKTKQDIISEIKTAFKFLFGNDEFIPEVVSVLKAPTSKSKLRLPEKMPDEKDIYRMIKASNNSRDKFYIAFNGLDAALRPIEARNIKFKDIKKDKYGYFITIHTAKKSGDKETRTVRIIKSEPYFIKWNQEYPAEKKDDAYVFINYSNLEQINQGTISALFKRLKEKLKISHLTPYTLRHAFITAASKNPQWPVSLLKKFIGHSLNSNTISEYQHFGDDDLKDAQLKVNGIIKDKDKKEIDRKPVVCPKCEKSNEYDAEFCTYCNMALSQKRQVEVNEQVQKLQERIGRQEILTDKKIEELIDLVKNMVNRTPNTKQDIKEAERIPLSAKVKQIRKEAWKIIPELKNRDL
jgi:integrase